MEPFDTELFIAQVQEHPAIWNYLGEEYCNKIERIKAWEKVCAGFYKNFHELDTKEQNLIAAQLQRKWKSIRDCFSRELKKRRSLKPGDSLWRKPYVYFDRLSFLQPVAEQRAASVPEDQNEEPDEEPLEPIVEIIPEVHQPKKKKLSLDDFPIKTPKEEIIIGSGEINKIPRYHDDNDFFCLSLSSDFRNISHELLSDAKIEVLQVLKKYKELSRNNVNFMQTNFSSNLPAEYASNSSFHFLQNQTKHELQNHVNQTSHVTFSRRNILPSVSSPDSQRSNVSESDSCLV